MSSGLDFTVYKGHKDGKILKSKTHKDGLAPDEVLLKITHAGLCGTDTHYKQNDMVLGHEGVGVVQQVGQCVRTFRIGERAGWGYLHNSCLHCERCLNGNEIFCDERAMYGLADLDQGAFASHIVFKAAFLFHIPDEISSAEAAPLMCGGSTVFNPLHAYDVKPTERVGVVGVGGLGHLAIQFASKMGCEVVVFSGSESKKEEAKNLGAKEFYATRGLKKINLERKLNHLIVTSSVQPDWKLFLPLIEPRGTIFPISVSEQELALPYMGILTAGLRIQGSLPCSRGLHMKMLDFAAHHGIRPIIETFPMTEKGIEDAFEKLEKGKIRYRGVLVAEN